MRSVIQAVTYRTYQPVMYRLRAPVAASSLATAKRYGRRSVPKELRHWPEEGLLAPSPNSISVPGISEKNYDEFVIYKI
jgi:hypothetical protein